LGHGGDCQDGGADQNCVGSTLFPADVGWVHPSRAFAAVPGYEKDSAGNLRQYITVTGSAQTRLFDPRVLTLQVITYPSDRYIALDKSAAVDTARDATQVPSAWSIVGVIEGVPPFTRNGTTGSVPKASVSFQQKDSKSTEVKVVNSFKSEVSLSPGSQVPSFPVTADLSYGLDLARSSKTENTLTLQKTLDNVSDNFDGAYGILIVAKPTIINYPFSHRTFGHTEVARVDRLIVDQMDLYSEPYLLADPTLGKGENQIGLPMPFRPKTSLPWIITWRIQSITHYVPPLLLSAAAAPAEAGLHAGPVQGDDGTQAASDADPNQPQAAVPIGKKAFCWGCLPQSGGWRSIKR
jgi:hypothetical protein